jgi:hypothetical protein
LHQGRRILARQVKGIARPPLTRTHHRPQ